MLVRVGGKDTESVVSGEVGVLFSPPDPANRLFPPQRTLEAVLDLINGEDLDEVWDEEETVG